MSKSLDRLKHHVTGAIERGEKKAITAMVKHTPGPWKELKEYPVADWQYEVANGDTRLGYLEWAAHQKEEGET